MTHLRLWKFEVPKETEAKFVAAYGSGGAWAKLFATAAGFMRTELWRSEDGSFLTSDHWQSEADFERFQANQGEEYRRLDAALEGVSGIETFIGAFDLAD